MTHGDDALGTSDSGASQRVNNIHRSAHCMGGPTGETIARILAAHPAQARSVIHVLQDVNRELGYLSMETLRAVATALRVPLSQAASVATFYKAFHLKPRGRTIVRVCMGTACYVRGARDVVDALSERLAVPLGGTTPDGAFTLETVNCLGSCALGPVLVAGQTVHGHLDRRRAVDVILRHGVGGQAPSEPADDPLAPPPLGSLPRLASPDDLSRWRDQLAQVARSAPRQALVCAGTGCRAAGAGRIVRALSDAIASAGCAAAVELALKTTGCHGFCEKGPLVLVQPEGYLYVNVAERDATEIVARSLVEGQPVDRLLCADRSLRARVMSWRLLPFYARQHRLTLRNIGRLDPADISQSIAMGGYGALAKALAEMTPEAIIGSVTRSGLRGRGGAGFPTGTKWRLARASGGATGARVLVCNGDEGDPGAYMDRSLFEGDPHSILEGMLIAAYAIGAGEGHCYIREEYPLALAQMQRAIESARRVGLLGKNILGTGLSFDVRIARGGGAFVCGEETALLQSIAGKPGYPVPRPPYPVESGLDGRPTVINNVETFATVPIIIAQGDAPYAALGTAGSRGTKVFSLVGKVQRSGLVEVPMGTTLRDLVERIGGGVPPGHTLKAVQIGGPSGGCLPASDLDRPLDYEALTAAGAIMGSGGIIVMDERTCMVDVARFFTRFLQDESCGKCVPCRDGLGALGGLLEGITTGRSAPGDLERIERLAVAIRVGSLCGLGKTAPNPVLSTLRYFRAEFLAHIEDLRCAAGVCRDLARFSVNAHCNGCTLCQKACPTGAMTGEPRARHAIGQSSCIHCGLCVDACHRGAIDILGPRDLEHLERTAAL